jgi:hypothetical protein
MSRASPDVFKHLSDFSRLTILLMDDHEDGREFLSGVLRAEAITVRRGHGRRRPAHRESAPATFTWWTASVHRRSLSSS